jgi:hypothetical protein
MGVQDKTAGDRVTSVAGGKRRGSGVLRRFLFTQYTARRMVCTAKSRRERATWGTQEKEKRRVLAGNRTA